MGTAKDGFGQGGHHPAAWSIGPRASAKGDKVASLPGAPPQHSSVPRSLEVAGEGGEHRRFQTEASTGSPGSSHTHPVTLVPSLPIRRRSPRWSHPEPPSSSRACTSSRPATLTCTWHKVGGRVHRVCTSGHPCPGRPPGGAWLFLLLLEGWWVAAWVALVMSFSPPTPMTSVFNALPLGDDFSFCLCP